MGRSTTGCRDFRLTAALSRRRLLQVGGLGMLGLGLPDLLRAKDAATNADAAPAAGLGKAKNCIFIFCWGGPSQLETWDPKPDAPSGIRGDFKPVPTSAPGVYIGEHLPRMARQMHRCSLIRSANHDNTLHGLGMYWMMTGHRPPPNPQVVSNSDWPTLGSMVSYLKPGRATMPGNVWLPYPLVDNGAFQAGQYAGFLGAEHHPFFFRPKGEAVAFKGKSPETDVVKMDPMPGMTGGRMQSRWRLLEQLNAGAYYLMSQSAGKAEQKYLAKATDLLSHPEVRQAFDITLEADKTAARYGPHLAGRSMLQARRLVEAGVRLVTVCCAAGDLNGGAGDMWDTHGDGFNRLKRDLLPPLDQGLSALLDDLDGRGILDETLVVVAGEFGRTPKTNSSGGRDHWPGVFSVVMAGGGVKGGYVHGASDHHAAYPAASPVSPADFVATVMAALGIDPKGELRDLQNRPIPACDGEPVREVFA